MSAYISKTSYTTAFYSGLLFEYQWQGSMLTYSIPSGTAYFPRNYSDRNEWDSWSALTTAEASAFRKLTSMANNYVTMDFREVPDSSSYGNIRVAYTHDMELDTLGYAYLPTPRFLNRSDPSYVSGDIWLSPQLFNSVSQPGTQFDHILMHELGHALGLSHPFEDDARFPAVRPQHDNFQYTVMSYTDHPAHPNTYPITFMPYDILALQYLYGANFDHSPGDSTHTFTNTVNIQTVWDPSGYNTLDFSAMQSGITIDMREGAYSSAGVVVNSYNQTRQGIDNLALAYGTQIHQLYASSNSDIIIGNSLDNTIHLGSGNDTYHYISGNDIIFGGSGINTLKLPGLHEDWLYIAPSSTNNLHKIDFNNSEYIIQFQNINQIIIEQQFFLLSELIQNTPDSIFIAELAEPKTPYLSPILVGETTVSAEEAQLYRVYLGALGREPDQAGFAWWLDKHEHGVSFNELIAGFYQSNEFIKLADKNLDGVISSIELLDHLYKNVLDRDPDVTGYNWWFDTIKSTGVEHEEVIFNFTQSDEYVFKTLQQVGDLLWV